jgi:hypothetical protein
MVKEDADMRPPRVRFTIRSMMIAVGIVAVGLAGELFLSRPAAREVSSHADGDYLWGEAVTAWIILNVVLVAPPSAMILHLVRTGMKHQAEDPKRVG